ncbi:ATP-binding protein [Streptomyces sp. 2A115]|uniref:ATP-binding protein n=1 Tax=Streptomyces sp. 2A115 TaxID=3457439 RepID=UPI003FD36570
MGNMTFGELLREARRRSLLTLENLAEVSGVSVRAISDMERGQSLPRQTTLNELLDALELDESQRRRLVQASVRRTAQIPQQLPPDLAVFRSRDTALTTVRTFTDQLATQTGCVAIAVIGGMAGVGKTTLAVHWAHQVADRFEDGQLYVNLRGFEDSGRPLEPGEALGGFLSALGMHNDEIPSGTREREALFRERVASRRLIVVLDNARDSQQVRPLLAASPGCLTIITSRNQLSGLSATVGARLIGLDVWSPAEAVAALAARIGDHRCRAEPEAVAELAALCGHLPLAIAVVGAQLAASPHMPLRAGVRELRETRPRLDALAADDRQGDVRAVFSWSYHALPDATARFFRRLAVHPAPALSAEAAASLAGADMPQARRHLRELTSASLLSRDAEGRYILHDLVRDYGTELIEQHKDDRLAAETRLLDYLRHSAYAANRFVSRYKSEMTDTPVPGVIQVTLDDREQALAWFRQEESTASAALRLLTDPQLLRHRINVTLEWVSYNSVVGRWTEETVTARIALDAALTLDDPAAIVRSSANLARALIETGRSEEADKPTGMILTHRHRLSPVLQARAERNLGWLYGRQERHTEALPHSRRALSLYRTLSQREEVARSLSDVGWDLAKVGRYEEAIATCEEAIPLLRRHGNLRFEAAAWDGIAYAQQGLGDSRAAIASYETSLRLYGEALDDYSQAEVLDHLAFAQMELGDVEGARASWTQSADMLNALHVARAKEMRTKAESSPPTPR